MHMQGTPATMQVDPHYDDVVAEVYDFLARRVEWAEAQRHPARADRHRPRHRLRQDGRAQPRDLAEPRSICQPGMCRFWSASRARGSWARSRAGRVAERAAASVVSSLAACLRGARVVRVHDVAAMVDAIGSGPRCEDGGIRA